MQLEVNTFSFGPSLSAPNLLSTSSSFGSFSGFPSPLSVPSPSSAAASASNGPPSFCAPFSPSNFSSFNVSSPSFASPPSPFNQSNNNTPSAGFFAKPSACPPSVPPLPPHPSSRSSRASSFQPFVSGPSYSFGQPVSSAQPSAPVSAVAAEPDFAGFSDFGNYENLGRADAFDSSKRSQPKDASTNGSDVKFEFSDSVPSFLPPTPTEFVPAPGWTKVSGNLYKSGSTLHVCDFNCNAAQWNESRCMFTCAISGRPSRRYYDSSVPKRTASESGQVDLQSRKKQMRD